MKQALMVLTLLVAGYAHAQGEIKQPCMKVKEACEKAGFEKGKHKEGKGLGLIKDCMQKLANGESVAGVTIGSDVVAACKEKRDQHKTKSAAVKSSDIVKPETK